MRALAPPALARLDPPWLLHTALATAREDEADVRELVRAATQRAEQALAAAARAEIAIDAVTWGAERYPSRLTQIADPPPLLWLHGAIARLAAPCLAIVGSRAASAYGIEVATRLATELAAAGLTVVSGLARGVDSAAHRGALASGGGQTIAVLGSGVDVIYPREHKALAAEIVAQGGLLASELPPGAAPRKEHFPRRNRLISGLSLGVLVIEASDRSGSLQTARFAAEQGRDVLAVPGSILGDRNRGTHGLLRDGAILVEQAADVLSEIAFDPPPPTSPPDDGKPADAAPLPASPGIRRPPAVASALGASASRDRLTAEPEAVPPISPSFEARRVLTAMDDGEVHDFQRLTESTGLAADALLRALLFLELDGRVVRTGDGRFLCAGRPVIR